MGRPFWLSRWKIMVLCGFAGCGGHACSPTTPRTVDGVASLLGDAVQGKVFPREFVWEAPNSVLEELVLGRRVLFLAAPTSGEPRDLYRARVRLSMEGHPLAVRDVSNLTRSPLGDEAALTADGPYASRHVAIVSTSYGKISGVTLFDLKSDGGVIGAKNALERLQGGISNWLETGSWSGIGRTDFSFENPVAALKISFQNGDFVFHSPENEPAHFHLTSGTFAENAEELGILPQRQPHLRKSSILWAVDTVRGILGPAPIAWLEETFFRARDTVRRAGYQLSSSTPAVVATSTESPPSPQINKFTIVGKEESWPPTRLPSIWQQPEPQEGVWEPVQYPFLKKLSQATDPPPYFYRTWVKPDPKRPYVQVQIVALDMRQLELNMEGGVEDPRPLTGAKSFGRIPRDPEILSRVVGAFNGAFKTTHGAYGMMVNRRVLLPPKPGAATVVLTEDHRVGMGAWGKSEEIPENLLSFRQNLDPLILDGKFNPTGRLQWGFQLAGHGVLTERSGICITKPGYFLYFWGDDLSGITLGKAMVQAGCIAGMHLDMNPKHTGFVFAGIRDIEKKDYDVQLLSPQMGILPERYVEWSPKDFFYITLRDIQAEAGTSVTWSKDAGKQPSPTWLPGVWSARSEHNGVEVNLLGLDAGRVTYRVRAGRQEGRAEESQRNLSDEEAPQLVAALGMANGRRPRGLGLVIGGKLLSTYKSGMGYLTIAENGELQITQGEPPTQNGSDIVELPLLLIHGNMNNSAEMSGPIRRRGGACVLPSGRMVIAISEANSDGANAMVLAKLGCKTAVALDRGTHEGIWLHRAGLDPAEVNRGEQTTLYMVGTSTRPRVFPWAP